MPLQPDPASNNTQMGDQAKSSKSDMDPIPAPEIATLSINELRQLVTAYQQQNEALRVAHNDYALIYNYSGVGYLTLNAAGKIQNSNPAAEKINAQNRAMAFTFDIGMHRLGSGFSPHFIPGNAM